MKKAENVAIPGALVATTEEYSASPSREGMIEEEGGIYASKLGSIEVDAARRIVSVKPARAVRLLREGDVVVARVENIYANTALTKIVRALESRGQRISLGSASAFLRISELGFYAENFRDAVKIGDVIQARVVEVSPLATYVTIAGNDLGVVRAFCSKCRSELNQTDKELVCPQCGSHEQRKLAGVGLPPGREPRREPGRGFERGMGRGFERRGRFERPRGRRFPEGRFPEREWAPRRRPEERGEREKRGREERGFRPRRKKIYGPRIPKNY